MLSVKKRIIKVIVFCFVFYLTYMCMVYAYRNPGYADRQRVLGFKNEDIALDMVLIGASIDLHSWEPIKAYEEYGFTSYDYCVNSMSAEEALLFMKQVQKYQADSRPLYVINLHQFIWWNDGDNALAFSNGLNSTRFNLERITFLNYLLRYHDAMSFDDKLSYYLELPIYLGDSRKFNPYQMFNTANESATKGYVPWVGCTVLKEPKQIRTDSCQPIDERADILLDDLMEYAKQNDIEILFYISPFVTDSGFEANVNYLRNRVRQQGFELLDLNQYYDEIGLDFSTDYHDSAHVNPIGAEKITVFLGQYLLDNYGLEDHRGDGAYADWDAAIAAFSEQEAENKTNSLACGE